MTLLDRALVHRRYLPNNDGTDLQLSVLRQIVVNEIALASMPAMGNKHTTIEP